MGIHEPDPSLPCGRVSGFRMLVLDEAFEEHGDPVGGLLGIARPIENSGVEDRFALDDECILIGLRVPTGGASPRSIRSGEKDPASFYCFGSLPYF